MSEYAVRTNADTQVLTKLAAFGSDDDDYDEESNDSSNFYTEDEADDKRAISDVEDLSPTSSTPSVGFLNEHDLDRFNIHRPNIL